jgi:hypothetical protein
MKAPKITRVRVHAYQWEVQDLGVDYNGFNQVYEPGARRRATGHIVAIETDQGVTGEYVGGDAASMTQIGGFARYRIGKTALER